MRKRLRGFTLIEVLLVILLLLILSAIAIPAYTNQVLKSRRAETQAYLLSAHARQQQFLLDTRAYAPTLANLGVPMPDNVALAYDVAMVVNAAIPPAFSLTATPRASQSREACGTLTINQTGARTAAVSGCW